MTLKAQKIQKLKYYATLIWWILPPLYPYLHRISQEYSNFHTQKNPMIALIFSLPFPLLMRLGSQLALFWLEERKKEICCKTIWKLEGCLGYMIVRLAMKKVDEDEAVKEDWVKEERKHMRVGVRSIREMDFVYLGFFSLVKK